MKVLPARLIGYYMAKVFPPLISKIFLIHFSITFIALTEPIYASNNPDGYESEVDELGYSCYTPPDPPRNYCNWESLTFSEEESTQVSSSGKRVKISPTKKKHVKRSPTKKIGIPIEKAYPKYKASLPGKKRKSTLNKLLENLNRKLLNF